jgi:hypothetical protein
LTKCFGSSTAFSRVGIVEGIEQFRNRNRAANTAKCINGIPTYTVVWVLEGA